MLFLRVRFGGRSCRLVGLRYCNLSRVSAVACRPKLSSVGLERTVLAATEDSLYQNALLHISYRIKILFCLIEEDVAGEYDLGWR